MRTIISIGALQTHAIINSLVSHRVIAYEPCRIFLKEYAKIQHSNFKYFPYAVSGKAGKAILHEHEGCSTICDFDDWPFNTDDEYEVKVVSMSSILKAYREIGSVHINCEGSEFSIITDTPLKLLKKCKEIIIEFHMFCNYFKFTEEDVQKCVSKLHSAFYSHRKTEHPLYVFKRRDDA